MLHKYLDGIKVSGEYMMTLLDRMAKESSGLRNVGYRNGISEQYTEAEQYLQDMINTGSFEFQQFSFPGKRILIAEDMAVNREIAGELLKQTGAETEFAEDGQICVSMVESAP